MNKIIKIGVLGTANIALRSVIPAILKLENKFKLIGIASRDNKKADFVLDKFSCPLSVGYERIVNDSQIDAIYIPLPNSLHYEWIEKSLISGKHVIVEKSLGCTFNEVMKLTSLAKKKNLILFENFQFRFHKQLEEIKNIIINKEIGELRCLRASFGFPPFKDLDNIRYDIKLGGGALLDAGAYTTKISQQLLGYNLVVKAANLNFNDDTQVEIWGGAYLKDSNSGIFAQLAFGFDNFYQCGIEIWGSSGKLYTNRLFTAPENFSPEIFIENQINKRTIVVDPENHFEKMLIHFYNLVCGFTNSEDEHIQNLDQARLLNEIKKLTYE
jgi:predicted dehydrogenase